MWNIIRMRLWKSHYRYCIEYSSISIRRGSIVQMFSFLIGTYCVIFATLRQNHCILDESEGDDGPYWDSFDTQLSRLVHVLSQGKVGPTDFLGHLQLLYRLIYSPMSSNFTFPLFSLQPSS